MKQELLEYLVRQCVREVLTQVREAGDETKGAPSPPADGLGTADQPPIPKDKETEPTPPEEPQAPTPNLKGIVFVNPKDKAKLQKVQLQGRDDASVERELHSVAAKLAGSKVKIALSTSRAVKDALRNPNASLYLYLGKYDPESDEVFLMADKSLQVAKDASIQPGEMTGLPTSTLPPNYKSYGGMDDTEYQAALAQRGKPTPRYGIDENLTKVIRKMVNEVLDRK